MIDSVRSYCFINYYQMILSQSRKRFHYWQRSAIILSLIFFAACNNSKKQEGVAEKLEEHKEGTFGYDAHFLNKYSKGVIRLEDGSSSVLILPEGQGRVMTSTAASDTGNSFGWINYE